MTHPCPAPHPGRSARQSTLAKLGAGPGGLGAKTPVFRFWRAQKVWRVVAVGVAVALLGACGGPKQPFELGLREVPSDLLLGGPKKPLPLPAQLPPSAPLDIVLPGGSAAPPPVDRIPPPIPDPPPPPPEPCPAADPLSAAERAVVLDITAPPVEATYRYRASGAITQGSQTANVEPTSVQTVDNIRSIGPGEFTYDVTAVHSGTTKTTYHVVPRTSTAIPPGLYIAAVDSGEGNVFRPVPEMRMLPFPAVAGTRFNVASSDGRTTIKYEGVVVETLRLDACGAFVDAIGVRFENGNAAMAIPGPAAPQAEVFTSTYYVATQYGGVITKSVFEGGSVAGDIKRSLTTLISEVPK